MARNLEVDLENAYPCKVAHRDTGSGSQLKQSRSDIYELTLGGSGA